MKLPYTNGTTSKTALFFRHSSNVPLNMQLFALCRFRKGCLIKNFVSGATRQEPSRYPSLLGLRLRRWQVCGSTVLLCSQRARRCGETGCSHQFVHSPCVVTYPSAETCAITRLRLRRMLRRMLRRRRWSPQLSYACHVAKRSTRTHSSAPFLCRRTTWPTARIRRLLM